MRLLLQNFCATHSAIGATARPQVGAVSESRAARDAINLQLPSRCSKNQIHMRDKPVSFAWDGFNVARGVGVVAQDVANLLDSGIQAMFEVNESSFGPELLAKLFPRDEFAGMFEQGTEDVERLVLQFEVDAVLTEFGNLDGKLKRAEAVYAWGDRSLFHTAAPSRQVSRCRLHTCMPGGLL